ncbi:rab-protein geranylgeranyltransferase [Pisolithus microcarpus]|nr:rab-protein geranylgeranyltransferase [Pisolithus microcarpus]
MTTTDDWPSTVSSAGSKIAEYLALTNDLISRKKNKDWSRDAFDATQRLLEKNPEFYTIWNYPMALKEHPKVYWLWNHRRWCLQNIPDGPIVDKHKLAVVEKMLNADPRNFMAWNYRRYKLAYTTRKISSSFSNFSAWHQRSKVYTSLWRSGQLDPVKSRDEELELIHNAIYTDPEDQSAWIYHRWLMGSGDDESQLLRELAVIEELLSEQPDSKWCMDSLVYYNKLLLKKHRPHSTELREKCLALLQQLEDIDPPRRYRYRESGDSAAPHPVVQ